PRPSRWWFEPLRGGSLLAGAPRVVHSLLEVGQAFHEGLRLHVLCEWRRRMGHTIALSSESDGSSVHTPGWQLLISGVDVNRREWTTYGRAQPSMDLSVRADTKVLEMADCILAGCGEHRCSTTVALASRAT